MHYIITWSTVPIKNILCIVYMLRLVNFFKNVLSIYFIKERGRLTMTTSNIQGRPNCMTN
jgi:hypothetical protein